MSDPKPDGKNGGVKTLGIRLPGELHAQFALVAQLDGLNLGDAVLRAVEFYVNAKRSEPDFAARAKAALEAIEREAAARRSAIEDLFGGTPEVEQGPEEPEKKTSASGSRRRSGAES